MPKTEELILGEFSRTFDERFRIALPQELIDPLLAGSTDCVLAKERPGCLSLWNARSREKLDEAVRLLRSKVRAGKLEGRIEELQLVTRLLSTRQRNVQLAGRSRLLVPEGFREFLEAEPGSEVFVVGAGVCLEIWNPQAWLAYLAARMPDFRQLFDKLTS